MDPLSSFSLCSISRREEHVWSVSFFGRVKDSGKDAVICVFDRQWHSWSCGDARILLEVAEWLRLISTVAPPVRRASPLEFGDWQSCVTWNEDACVWR